MLDKRWPLAHWGAPSFPPERGVRKVACYACRWLHNRAGTADIQAAAQAFVSPLPALPEVFASMRLPTPLTLAAIAVSALNLALAFGWSLPWPVGIGAAAVILLLSVRHERRDRREREALEQALGHLAEFRLPLPDGVRHELLPQLKPLIDGYERVFLEMQRREEALAERVARYEFMELHTDDIVMQVDAQGRVKYVSPAMQRHLGYTPEEMKGRRIMDLLHPSEREWWIEQLKAGAREHRVMLLEGRWRHKDGHYVTQEMSLCHAYGLNGSVVETISMARNVESRNEMREKLTRAALTDQLTGLPNRAALVASLERFRAMSHEKPFVLFLFDLDRFKQVNDSLGHAAGDDYLIETANRVRTILRPGDMLARMGGDEFVALFEGVATEEGARSIAARILHAVSAPFSCQGALLYPKTSIGIVVCNDPAVASDELIMRADRAMYAAKRQGGNLAIVYNGSHSASLREAFEVEQDLTRALQHDRLVVEFQPIVQAHTGLPVLAEALVRMRGEDGRLRPPSEFIEVAEKTGQILQVGQWVLEQACWQARTLEEAGMPTQISVNVSPRQLMHVNFVRSVESVLEQTGVSPSSIVLEVTESAVMEDADKAKAILLHLRSLGFTLALDDFGTGYSSISMLKSLPFDIVKIDRSFVHDVGAESVPGRLMPTTLGAIIDIGKSLQLKIIAEGVETSEQARALERLGCDLLQGFRFYRPMEAAALVQAVTARRMGPLALDAA
jgi:diguanylate cyclase (GGDEF)-like protein/PAS domain S-box-containing protein